MVLLTDKVSSIPVYIIFLTPFNLGKDLSWDRWEVGYLFANDLDFFIYVLVKEKRKTSLQVQDINVI